MQTLTTLLLIAAIVWLVVETKNNKRNIDRTNMKLNAFIDAQEAHNQKIGTGLTDLSASYEGISDDVTGLKKDIEDLRNGDVDEETGTKLQGLLDRAADLDDRTTKAAAAAKALNEATPPKLPTTGE